MRASNRKVRLSVIAPAHNEEDNVGPLVEETARALRPLGLSFEIILVDDGSTDGTAERILAHCRDYPELRLLRLPRTTAGGGNGQSAAFRAGFHAARGEVIAVLDADLQNDPAEIPRMLEVMEELSADLVQGDRSGDRHDTSIRKVGSMVGRLVRRWLLGDCIRDTGCSLRVMRRVVARALPLEYRGMHRFIPITARQLGYRVVEVPVRHRPRVAGEAKYGRHAIRARALPGLLDCLAVRWMSQRRCPVAGEELTPPCEDHAVETAEPMSERMS